MPISLKNTKPSEQNDFQFDPLLSQLHGNILKGHGRVGWRNGWTLRCGMLGQPRDDASWNG